jgi:hypothetical protein
MQDGIGRCRAAFEAGAVGHARCDDELLCRIAALIARDDDVTNDVARTRLRLFERNRFFRITGVLYLRFR